MSAVGFQSDSYQLVETCLAQLRLDARLDDDPVLPTLDVLPDLAVDVDVIDVDESELVIVCESVKALPSAASIVRASVRANQEAASQKDVPTLRRMKAAAPANAAPARKPARWPVVLCALVATYAGVSAFMRSPLGTKPEVQHAVKVAQGKVTGALASSKSLVRR